ncbi:hypothetical protein [Nitrosomonas sp. Nm33]|uniref:hypothetical protein n=1 Tax=Nitrosomonas sp. Nm33 TaxID=133724 RepID=UPI00089B524E|nr:hypothetical protein [Nitrosomonas sp. Nm33]SDY85235.1 hypothetical protein SAMN05421755_105520 [Nitrosomonas sp. Nm33]
MEILSTREWALVIWISGITGLLLLSPKFKEVPESFQSLVKAFLVKQIITIMILMTVYVIVCVYSLSQVSLWEWYQLKVTAIWYITVAASILFRYELVKQNPRYCINLVLDSFKLTGVIGSVVSVYTFNIFFELILVLFLFFIGGMLGIAQSKKEFKLLTKILNGILIGIGSLVVIYSIYMIYDDFAKLTNKETLRDFYIPPLLTLAYLPFIFFMVLYITYDLEFRKLYFFIKNKKLRIYSKACAFVLFHIRLVLLERWVSSLAFHKPDTISDINQSFRQLFKAVSAESNPPEINNSEGWSPYAAKDFLTDEGIKTGYYHPAGSNEWFSNSKMIELEGAIISNNISYYVIGDEHIARYLKLRLNVNSPEGAKIAHDKLLSLAKLLFAKATNIEFPSEIETALKNGINYVAEIGIYTIRIEKQVWPCHRNGGYDVKFIIACM